MAAGTRHHRPLSGRLSGRPRRRRIFRADQRVQKFGAFVRLDETGADGLLPIREIGANISIMTPDQQVLLGSETGWRSVSASA